MAVVQELKIVDILTGDRHFIQAGLGFRTHPNRGRSGDVAEAGSFADRVKQQADIVRVVGEYVRLKKSGQNFSGPVSVSFRKDAVVCGGIR